LSGSLLIRSSQTPFPEAWYNAVLRFCKTHDIVINDNIDLLNSKVECLDFYAGPSINIPNSWDTDAVAITKIYESGYVGVCLHDIPKSIYKLPRHSKLYCGCATAKMQLQQWRPDYQFIDQCINNIDWKTTTAICSINELDGVPDTLNRFDISTEELIPNENQGLAMVYYKKARNDTFQAFSELMDLQLHCIFKHHQYLRSAFFKPPLLVFTKAISEDNYRWVFTSYVMFAQDNTHSMFSLRIEKGSVLQKIAEKLQKSVDRSYPQSIFISRALQENGSFMQLCKTVKTKVLAKSFSDVIPIKINHWPETDWVFFTSKLLLEYYFNANPPLKKVRYACWGATLAKQLREMGLKADFIGASESAVTLAKQFQLVLGKGHVLIPGIKNGPQGIQSILKRNAHVHVLDICIANKTSEISNMKFDKALLTSPQQAVAFLNAHCSANHFIVNSTATSNVLKSKGIKSVSEWPRFDDFGLWQALQVF
jgi:uroporphyrinogen-III synthase